MGYVTAATSDSLAACRSHRRGAAQTLRRVRAERYRVIDEALADGHTLTDIAAALGISRQALAAFLERRESK